MTLQIELPQEQIVEFCRARHVQELALFGSVLRADFGPESDIDVLVAFGPEHSPSLEEWLDMHDELRAIFGRPVDLVERRRVKNPFRRYEILTTRHVVYAA